MEQVKNLGNIALWLLGHMAFTMIVNLTALGAYYCYQQYQASMPVQIDISQLNEAEKEALALALVDDGYSVPKDKKKG